MGVSALSPIDAWAVGHVDDINSLAAQTLLNGGAASVRAELTRKPNAARLGFKKVIVYQFAIRSLLTEHWEPVSMVTPERPVR